MPRRTTDPRKVDLESRVRTPSLLDVAPQFTEQAYDPALDHAPLRRLRAPRVVSRAVEKHHASVPGLPARLLHQHRDPARSHNADADRAERLIWHDSQTLPLRADPNAPLGIRDLARIAAQAGSRRR
jgi:hypothetical protein